MRQCPPWNTHVGRKARERVRLPLTHPTAVLQTLSPDQILRPPVETHFVARHRRHSPQAVTLTAVDRVRANVLQSQLPVPQEDCLRREKRIHPHLSLMYPELQELEVIRKEMKSTRMTTIHPIHPQRRSGLRPHPHRLKNRHICNLRRHHRDGISRLTCQRVPMVKKAHDQAHI